MARSPDKTLAVALTAAHEISPRVQRTWSPQLDRGARVLVPVQLDALVVRQKGGVFANLKMAVTKQGDRRTAKSLATDPFSDTSRDPGVYLQWALPDALTQGAQSADGKVIFPPIPDRWLVVRLSPSADPARRAVRGWVLQAWDETPVRHDLATWTEPGVDPATAQTLNALGRGDLAWSAVYDNVENRLGIYDNLDGVTTGPLSYLVTGWYASSAFDPLGDPAIRSLADFESRMSDLGWELPTGSLDGAVTHSQSQLRAAFSLSMFRPKGSFDLLDPERTPKVDEQGNSVAAGMWWPRGTLFHGAVVGLGWPGPDKTILGGEVGGPPVSSSVQASVGNTSVEALAVLVAQKNGAPDQARLLEAFQLDLLSELDRPDGRARLDARLHESAFGSLPGGSGKEELFQAGTPGTPAPAAPGTPDPGIFADRNSLRPQPPKPPPSTVVSPDVRSTPQTSRLEKAEVAIDVGALRAVAAGLDTSAPPPPPPRSDGTVEVRRSLPRFFHPTDPVILVQGGRRSFKHGGDGRFGDHETLACRLSGLTVDELTCVEDAGTGARAAVRGEDLLAGAIDHGATPPECEALLREAALLDPGSAQVAARAAHPAGAPGQLQATAQKFLVEQTVWWATRDPRADHALLLARSGLGGTLPSPIAITPPVAPWAPILLEWAIAFEPSAGGERDWSLGEIDFAPSPLPQPNPSVPLSGRAILSGGLAATAAGAIRKSLARAAESGTSATIDGSLIERFASPIAGLLLDAMAKIPVPVSTTGPVDRGPLADLASTLEAMDVLSGSLDGLNTGLRGGLSGDGETTSPSGIPSPFFALRAGGMRFTRLRLVDGFGQVLDLAGSSATKPVDPKQLLPSEPMSAPERPELMLLPPRFTSPSRLWLRYTDAADSGSDADASLSPVCGFLVPNHLEGALELFDAGGELVGTLRPDPTSGVAWDDAPGRSSTVGQGPPPDTNRHLAGIARSLQRWGIADASTTGRETALSALQRIVDSTLWSVDPFAHVGEEHLALLVGHPVAVLRARLLLELSEPVDPDCAHQLVVPVRLGALAHWNDGLFGLFVGGNYNQLICTDAAIAGFSRELGPGRGFLGPINLVPDYYQTFADDLGAGAVGDTPVDHPYVASEEVVWLHPNQPLDLTLLVEPFSVVHATAGFLPRKEIGMRREWLAAALDRLGPTFRTGPVLVDAKSIRMPVASDLNGTWSWSHRTDVATWSEDPVVRATSDALLTPDGPVAQEGWLRLTPRTSK